jgi:hypothetical protein
MNLPALLHATFLVAHQSVVQPPLVLTLVEELCGGVLMFVLALLALQLR